MEWAILTAYAALLGLVFGSFVAAAAYRMPRGLSLWGRSRCTGCGTALGVRDLVPVLSWLTSRGRCRSCGSPVSARYTAVELATAGIWVGSLLLLRDPAMAATVAGLATLLLLASLIDLEHYYLPDSLTALAAALALVPLYRGWLDPVAAATGALLFGGLALALRAVMSWRMGREALGLGDVKLMALAGLWLGPGMLAPFLVLSGVGGLVLALARRLAAGDGGPQVPFGPALALALCVLLMLKLTATPPLPWGMAG